MSKAEFSSKRLAHASALVVAAGFAAAAPTYALAETDSYMAGDFHNHSTCTDGSASVETAVKTSVATFGLEWMGQVDHGGNGSRDCRFDDVNRVYWDQQPAGKPAITFKGDNAGVSNGTHKNMWRWQMLQEIVYPEMGRVAKNLKNPMLFVGLESIVPGHEHVSTTVLGSGTTQQQLYAPGTGTADAMAEFEFRFDRGDNDMSGPGGTPGVADSGIWKGKVANPTGAGSGTTAHITKAVPSVKWMQDNFPLQSFYVPAHLERAGAFNPNSSAGYNIEHLRDFNNAGPTVAVGFETMPGHQAAADRGEYSAARGSVGSTTYGGAGIYGAKIGGVWDALLGEGRNWFFYASSDWHHRGSFSIFDRATTLDFYPGEYTRLYIPRPTARSAAQRIMALRPPHVVNSVRNGNSFSVTGDLISGDLLYKAEIDGQPARIAKMGETLVVPRGSNVRISLTVVDPSGTNNSPYSFPNPSLLQNASPGAVVPPLNKPVLDHVDFIKGDVTGIVAPTDANYVRGSKADDAVYNPSAVIYKTFGGSGYSNQWTASGDQRSMTFVIPNVQNSQYVRVRGTNLPAGTPFETDTFGNPLADPNANSVQIPCTDPACPSHMVVRNNVKYSTYDVGGWADLWFYTNPIFIRVSTDGEFRVERARKCADQLAAGTRLDCAAFVASN